MQKFHTVARNFTRFLPFSETKLFLIKLIARLATYLLNFGGKNLARSLIEFLKTKEIAEILPTSYFNLT